MPSLNRALLRSVIIIGDKMAGLAQQSLGKSGDQVLDQAQSWITSLAERRTRNEPRMVRDILVEFVDGVARRAEGQETAISTGIDELDNMLNGGLRPQQLIIVAGRPSMGKTALASDIGLNIASNHGVLMFSMEMSGQEVAGRALANRGRIELAKVMGKIEENDTLAWNGISHGCQQLADVRFAIDDTAAITLLELRMKAKAWKRKHGLDVIIVDYLGLMSGGEGDKRTDQIGSYSRGLKALAKDLGVTVIALAQLNRKSEDRGDRRPILSDLRDSGEIEQDADVVILVHRPEMHNPNLEQLRGYTEAMIRKQRSGSLGDVPTRCGAEGAHRAGDETAQKHLHGGFVLILSLHRRTLFALKKVHRASIVAGAKPPLRWLFSLALLLCAKEPAGCGNGLRWQPEKRHQKSSWAGVMPSALAIFSMVDLRSASLASCFA